MDNIPVIPVISVKIARRAGKDVEPNEQTFQHVRGQLSLWSRVNWAIDQWAQTIQCGTNNVDFEMVFADGFTHSGTFEIWNSLYVTNHPLERRIFKHFFLCSGRFATMRKKGETQQQSDVLLLETCLEKERLEYGRILDTYDIAPQYEEPEDEHEFFRNT